MTTRQDVLAYLVTATKEELYEFQGVIDQRLNRSILVGVRTIPPTPDAVIENLSPQERERIRKKYFDQ